MARSEKSENKNRVLGLDIGNGYGYVSLLENPKNDPIPLLPASLSTQGMPTTAYVSSITELRKNPPAACVCGKNPFAGTHT